MKKMFGLLVAVSLFHIHSFSQPYQLEEDQRLSTSNNVSFQNISLLDASFPKIDFNGRLLFRSITDNNLKWRYNGVNDAELLHAANFNSYAPTLTGAGASGNWNINAASWGGQNFYGTTTDPINSYMLGLKSSGVWGAYDPYQIRTFLGIPSGGETLQSITDRDNVTSNVLQVTGIGHGKTNTLGLELDYNGYGDNRGRVFSYDRVNNIYKGLRLEGSDLIINAASGGNVGIGTTSPSSRLEVIGMISSSGSSTTGSGTVSNMANLNNGIRLNGDISNASQNGITYQSGGGGAAAISFFRGGGYQTGIDFYTNHPDNHGFGNMIHRMRLTEDGNLGIGTATPGAYKLAVEGTIGARKIKVTQEAWADYVFDSSYQLPTLHQVEKYIQQNKHLPEVPSAAEVKQDGIDLGDNQAVLLKKIEELTLYIIEQDKRIKKLEEERK